MGNIKTSVAAAVDDDDDNDDDDDDGEHDRIRRSTRYIFITVLLVVGDLDLDEERKA